jgi:peptidoglycan/LPS O-acetylase OafA/YrhL
MRGVLVFSVVVYHFSITDGTHRTVFPGSYVAVGSFFTLSGFLITSLLLVERERAGSIDGRGFWVRRFRRLVPASITVVLLCVLVSAVSVGVWALSTGDVIASLLSFQNWHAIALASRNPLDLHLLSPLAPYWSLAVEEQFYVVLFVVVMLSMRARRPLRAITLSLCGLWLFSVASVLLVHGSVQRELFGTDTRTHELVAGCLLAVIIHRFGWPKDRRWVALGWVALAVTVFGWIQFSETAQWVRDGGMILFGFINVGLILGAVTAGSFASVMTWRPFAAVGRLSYGVYLIHWPVALLMSVQHMGGLDGWPLNLVRFATTLALAYVISRWIERPVRSRAVLPGWTAFAVWSGVAIVTTVLAFAVLGA